MHLFLSSPHLRFIKGLTRDSFVFCDDLLLGYETYTPTTCFEHCKSKGLDLGLVKHI